MLCAHKLFDSQYRETDLINLLLRWDMKALPETMYPVHDSLKAYVAVHNAVFKKFSFAAIFRSNPFGEHEARLAEIVAELEDALTPVETDDQLPQVFVEYVTALKATVESLQHIFANLHGETEKVGSYKYRLYRGDVAAYHALEARYQDLGTKLNQLITHRRE